MKQLIKQLLRETMLSNIDNWRDNLSDYGAILSTLISKDDESGEKLYLFVGFNEVDGQINYSYSFMLIDEENNALFKNYVTNRSVVAPYIPQDIKNKRQIFPLIMDMTRMLLDKELPQIIVRQTSEPLSGDSLKRYEEITQIMVNEYGYTVIEESKDKFGGTRWVLSKTEVKDNNQDLEETYNISHSYTKDEIAQKVFGGINLKKLKS
jgi:hypothetical protein